MKTWTFRDVGGEDDDTTSILRTRFHLSYIINPSNVAELNYRYISQEMCQIKMDQHHQTFRIKWASQTGSHKFDWKELVACFIVSVVLPVVL